MAGPAFVDLLGQTGLITTDQFQALRQAHSMSGRPAWELVLDQGLSDESPLFDAIARVSGVPRLNLRLARVDRSATSKMQRDWAEEHGIAPLWADPHRGTLAVAVVDPTRQGALRALSARLGLEVRRELATPSEVRDLIQHQFDNQPLDRDPERVNRRAEDIGVDASALVEDESVSPSWDALMPPTVTPQDLEQDGLQRATEPGLEGLFVGPARTQPPPAAPPTAPPASAPPPAAPPAAPVAFAPPPAAAPGPARQPPPPTAPPRRPPTPAPAPSPEELGMHGLQMKPASISDPLSSHAAPRSAPEQADEQLTVRHVPKPPRMPPPRPPEPEPEPQTNLRKGVDPSFPVGFSSLPQAPPPPRQPPTAAPGPGIDMAADLKLPEPPARMVAPPTPDAALAAPPPGPTGSEPDAPFARLPPNHAPEPSQSLGPKPSVPPVPSLDIEIEDEHSIELELELEDDPPPPTPLQAARISPSASKAPTPAAAVAQVSSAERDEQEALQRLLPVFEANQETARALKAVFELCLARGVITREEYLARLQSTPD